MVAASKFTVEVRINEAHIGAGQPALMGSPQQDGITPTSRRAEALAVPTLPACSHSTYDGSRPHKVLFCCRCYSYIV